MRLIFAIFTTMLKLPFLPIIVLVLCLIAIDWDDFKGEFADLMWSY